MNWQLIGGIITIIGLWLGFLEKRFADMRVNFETRLDEKNKVNEVIQTQLKSDLARLEAKIDKLIELQYMTPPIHRNRDDNNG